MPQNDLRLIEAGFPCHQVGAETQRERGASSALPPLYFLHVWWARRPLTPSRAAIVASLDPADTNPETFVRELGIERKQAMVGNVPWTLTGTLLERVRREDGREFLLVDAPVARAFRAEQARRAEVLAKIRQLRAYSTELAADPLLARWEAEAKPLPENYGHADAELPVRRVMGDPAHVAERIDFAKRQDVKAVLGGDLRWDTEDLYGYGRAFANDHPPVPSGKVVLDPTSGGGSIPFEALRLGHTVIANELNPVATTILYATLDYPARFGPSLVDDIQRWGGDLVSQVEQEMAPYYVFSRLPEPELTALRQHLVKYPDLVEDYTTEYDYTGFLYTRQITCPHCQGEAPLLNTLWLSKEAGDPWGVRVVTNGQPRGGKVHFETYRVRNGRGPNGENPEDFTVSDGVGKCLHCRQAIDGDEIKLQARGESPHGEWQDRLYAVVAVRKQPKLDRYGNIQRFTTGLRAGQIKTEKIRYFRIPNTDDLGAITKAEVELQRRWVDWDAKGLIPTERFPEGNDNRPITYGMPRWCDLFTPRQLLGHLSLIEQLNTLKPMLLSELGTERGKAVATYLQFAIDKGLDYNSKQTRWEFTRGVIKGTFGRHDFSLKWTFGEMIFTGPGSGSAWGLSQVTDAISGITELVRPLHLACNGEPPVRIVNGSATHMGSLLDDSVDLVCMDPPYYDNVQYAELSDYFFVWQKRTLADLYPELFSRRLTDKENEAVANTALRGSRVGGKQAYERLMAGIFRECRRVLRDDGVMTLMFTHKSQDAWETLTRALIDAGWSITAAFPVESEGSNSTHQMNLAAAASSIFIACRKRASDSTLPSFWTGFGGGVASQIRNAVKQALADFEPLKLNPVDRMVASYGRALHVLSDAWPVMDGDEQVGPLRAMNEASRVVMESEISRITGGRLTVDDLDPETAMALTLYGIYGLSDLPYDEALNLSKSLNIGLEGKTAGYRVEGRMIGINQVVAGRGRRAAVAEEETGYHAPVVRSGSKLRLAKPEERAAKRLEAPQTAWDVMHGLIGAYREGDVPVARAYLQRFGADKTGQVLDLLTVWAAEIDDKVQKTEVETLLFGLRTQG